MRGLLRGLAATLVVAGLLLVPTTPAAAATPPANDAYAAARSISGLQGYAHGTLAGATIEPDCTEPEKGVGGVSDRSVWYRWVPPTNGWLRFDLRTYGGWTGHVDAATYRGSCRSSAVQAHTSNSVPGAYAEVEVTRGRAVWLGVYGYGPENAGQFALSWREIPRPPPLNDDLARADVVWGRYGEQWHSNLNATRQSGEPAHAGRTGGRSVWVRWTAPLSGPAMFHAAGDAGWDCLVAVYTGSTVGALTAAGADASTAPGNSCTARFTATAGTTYAVAVDGERGEETSAFLLTWNSGPRPPHDAITSARTITGFHGVLNDTNRGATDEPGEPADAATRSGSSVWYRWVAPADGTVTFDVHSPPLYHPTSPWEEDMRVAVFTGTPGALTLVGASETPPETSLYALFTAQAGRTYWVQVTGEDARVVHYQLTWRLLPEANDDFAGALALPGTGSVTTYTTGATAEPGEPGHGLHGYAAARSVWFRWTAPQTGTVTFDDYESTDGYFAQPALSAYTGDRVDALTRVPVTHEFMTGDWRRWSFAATAGTTYRIALDSDSPFRYGMRHRLNWYYGARNHTPPTVALTAPADRAVVSGRVTVSAAATDADGIWSAGHSHDLAATEHTGPEPEAAPYDFVLDTERYGDGPLVTTATAWDPLGNLGRSAERTLVVENRPPSIRWFRNAPDRLTTETSAVVGWEAREPLSRAQCSLDGGAYADCQDYPGVTVGEEVYAGLADGVHVMRVRFTDMNGRTSVDPDAWWWVIDTRGVGVLPPDDATAPSVTAPVPDVYAGTPVEHTTAPVRMSWTSRDATSGVQRHDMQVSVNGGTWRAMPTVSNHTRAIYQLSAGRSYRFRVRAWDWAGHVSGWAYGAPFTVGLTQENAGWSLSPSWRRVALPGASGGYVARTTVKGAVARHAFYGRSVALYGPKLPSLGLSAVYLDGVRVATLNQWDNYGEARAALFVRNRLDPNVRHVLEIRSLGQPGAPYAGTAVAVDVATRVR